VLPVAQNFSIFPQNLPTFQISSDIPDGKHKRMSMASHLLNQPAESPGGFMLNMYTDTIGDMAVVECEGSIARSDEATRLRETVTSYTHAHVIIIDLSEVNYTENTGLAVLAFLQRWARENEIQLKLFNPSAFVRHQLKCAGGTFQFEFASLQEAMALLTQADPQMHWLQKGSELQHSAA
jgi:anti-anti-sigma factor